jgi:pyruvate formate-lyase activating enzyme-like uncharacterized protein
MCARGAKLVLLVTGLCNAGCFYCPLSEEKTGRDVTYANERLLGSGGLDIEAIFDEARLMDAMGTGITGGDPLCVPDRTVEIIRALKEEFGPDHHIHLYTATRDPARIPELEKAGLDEIRFHPPPAFWEPDRAGDYEPLAAAMKTGMRVGVEIPALPDRKDIMMEFLRWLAGKGVHFVNLNELEFSQTNADALKERGYSVKDDVSAGVAGSEEATLDIVRTLAGKGVTMPVHYCSSSFKDRVQLRNRLRRRAARVIRPLEVLTDDDTLLFGIVLTEDPQGDGAAMAGEYDIPGELWEAVPGRGRVDVAPWILEEVAADIDRPCYLVEEYPTYDRLEVERRPLK